MAARNAAAGLTAKQIAVYQVYCNIHQRLPVNVHEAVVKEVHRKRAIGEPAGPRSAFAEIAMEELQDDVPEKPTISRDDF